ncbi:hypothetical protein [Pseudomonas citronellolis]|uniref:hypothetical protein n=1 Tax=Pseudomonas citronellolis TaxID=53408 RepID=UPI0023E402E9|nr:hypothetical protein [Pseudomonas citronellolis]MDF3933794.1 hypothetical protein [Pseudomonas citronellolis]
MPTDKHPRTRRWLRRTLGLGGGLAVATLGFFAWQTFYPVQAASGWEYRVAHEHVLKAAALSHDGAGNLLVSQELREGQGSILRIAADGTRSLVVEGLSKPDGMLATTHGIAFSQEGGAAPVSLLGADGSVTALFDGINVQGMWDDGQYLYTVEDRKGDGRLLRYEWASRRVEVLRANLSEAESLTRCADGRMFYTEKDKGVVRQLTQDASDPVYLAGLNQPSFLLCDSHGLWISEDATHRARLLLATGEGAPRTVLAYLKAPQAILPLGGDRYLLAEGGRNRVLEFNLAP